MAAYRRSAIRPFSLANPAYVGARVYFYTVDLVTGLKTSVLATLYAGTTGVATLSNPQTLDANGKFAVPVYHDVPVVGVLQQALVPDHETGVLFPSEVADLDDVTATSVSSRTIAASGTIAFDIEPSKKFKTGMPVTVAFTTTPAKAIYGVVFSYNASTGAFVLTAQNANGVGETYALWTITLKGDRGEVGPPVSLGAAAPQALGTASAGVAAAASREDHVHPLEPVTAHRARTDGQARMIGRLAATAASRL